MFLEYTFQVAFLPTVATLVSYLYDSIYKKEKKTFQNYYNLFFGLLVIEMFFFCASLRACNSIFNDSNCDISSEMKIKEELCSYYDIECLTNSQYKNYQSKLEIELQEGHRCFNEARNLCLMIPNSTDQEKVQKLYDIAITTAAGYTLAGFSGVVGALSAQLCIYLNNYIIEFQQMKTLLLKSKSHYEMAAFYQEILEKG